jgi:hypothetical protein
VGADNFDCGLTVCVQVLNILIDFPSFDPVTLCVRSMVSEKFAIVALV